MWGPFLSLVCRPLGHAMASMLSLAQAQMGNQVLTHQNQKLAMQLEGMRRENKQLQDKLGTLDSRQQEYAHTLLGVRRGWDQFNSDVQYLCSTIDPTDAADAQSSRPPQLALGPGPGLTNLDPYMQCLLAGAEPAAIRAAASAASDLASELSDVEQALLKRSEASKQALTQLLKAVQQLQGLQPSSGPVDPAAPTAQLAQVQRKLDVHTAQLRLLTEERDLANDRWREATEKVKELDNELADTEQELTTTQRKLVALRSSTADGAGSSAPPPASSAPRLPPVRPSLLAADSLTDPAMEEGVAALLAKRTAELDGEREAHAKTSRELSEALARISQESSWVSSTRAFQAAQSEVTTLQELLATRARECEGALRERDQAVAAAADRNLILLRESQLAARCAELNGRCVALGTAKAEAEAAKAEAQVVVLRERERADGGRATAELRAMVASLQADLALRNKQVALAQVPGQRVAQAAEEVAEARTCVAAVHLEADRARTLAAERATQVAEAKRREEGVTERARDLQVFVDVLTSYCGAEQAAKDVATARAQEKALHVRVAQLQSQLEAPGTLDAVSNARANEQAAQARAVAAESAADALRAELTGAQCRLEQVHEQLLQARSECELYTSEIEATSTAYEEMQSQNQRLLGALADKEEVAVELSAQKLKLIAQVARLEESVENWRAEAERALKEAREAGVVREAAEREVSRLNAELATAWEHTRGLSVRVAGLEHEVRRRDEATGGLEAQLDAAQRAAATQREAVAEEAERGVKERTKRTRLEEEHRLLAQRYDKLRRTAGSASTGGAREAEEELDAMRKLLNCNVCHERQKNVIITKCCHVFCDRCIKKNLENRNRKCPGCGAAFGQADVKQFFFT